MKTLNSIVLHRSIAAQMTVMRSRQRVMESRQSHTNERGEGVISVALAVLIMAALAAGMWVAYKAMWDDASTRTANEVKKIGS
jgi:type II secretory pathway component PulK